MKRTVISHFYNEEYLLPWWLNHHKQVFHHGIMIDYASTDRSREIIRSICPDWEIVDSRNKVFEAYAVDREVMDIEAGLDGWRMCLNVTEQLIGDYSYLDTTEHDQLVLLCMTFVDRHNTEPDPAVPLYQQFTHGANWNEAYFLRMSRSIHRKPIHYNVGRHFHSDNVVGSDQLTVLYYGWCPFNDAAIQRRISMGDNMDDTCHQGRHHITSREELLQKFNDEISHWYRDQSPLLQQYIHKHEQTKIII
jgi:hypothetical protein